MPRKAELKKMGRCHLNRTCVVLTEKKVGAAEETRNYESTGE
jgi:hypothetical protein